MNDNHACCPSHCCDQHGCKYGMDDCPVTLKNVLQLYPCQVCGETESGYYGEINTLGYYDDDMTWHPPVGSADHEREIEDRLIAKITTFLRLPISEEYQADPQKAGMYRVICRVARMIEERDWEKPT